MEITASIKERMLNVCYILCCSYEMTPTRKPVKKKSVDPNNYCIDELNSEDSTDDEDKPRKRIPAWATGLSLYLFLGNIF